MRFWASIVRLRINEKHSNLSLQNVPKILPNLRLGVIINFVLTKKKCRRKPDTLTTGITLIHSSERYPPVVSIPCTTPTVIALIWKITDNIILPRIYTVTLLLFRYKFKYLRKVTNVFSLVNWSVVVPQLSLQ